MNLIKFKEGLTDALLAGIVETIIKDSPILQQLPFIAIEGNTLTYWREKALPGGVAWYSPDQEWGVEVKPEVVECTGTLKIVGANMDFDQYTRRTRPAPEDYDSSRVEMYSKAMRHEFEDSFINGLGTSGSKDFAGLDALVPVHADWVASTAYSLGNYVHATAFNGFRYECTTAGTSDTTEPTWPTTEGATVEDDSAVWTCRRSQLVSMGANGAALTLRKLDELMDKILGGRPDMLLMSRRSNRDLNHLVRVSGAILHTKPDYFGAPIQLFSAIPIGVSDWIADNKTVGSSTDCSTVYAFQMGESALAGLSWPEMINIERIGKLQQYDAERIRVKWYVGLALMSGVKLARLIGVRPV